MKDRILEIIKMSNGKVSFGYLIKKLDIKEDILKSLLNEMKLDGQILEESNKYAIFPDNMLIGEVSVTKSRNKVIFYDGKMVFVASNFFDYVILNDTVSFKINDRGEAEVTSIINRKIRDVTCKVVSNGKKKKLECFYKGIDVNLPKFVMDNLVDGDIISVSIGLNDIGCNRCECTFNKIIGHADEPNIDEIIIGANYGYSNDYSDEYEEEVAKIPSYVTESDCMYRHDERDLPFTTVDCVRAKDMDDAVYGHMMENGNFKVYVAIADVSHFVKLNTKIFERAFELGNSCYINNTVFHMLHPVLSNGICSLNPNEDRLTKTVIMEITPEGKIVNYSIHKSVIKSRMKMDYDSVDKVLLNKEIPVGYEEYKQNLRVLYKAALSLEKDAFLSGRLNFPNDENIKEYDEFGNVIAVLPPKLESTPSEVMIEQLMIAANRCVASYVLSCCVSSVFRNHKSANVVKVNDVLKNINEENRKKDKSDPSRIHFKLIDNAEHPKVLQAILGKLSNLDEYPILASIILQSIERAEYNVDNIGHYALNLDEYTHFTSPIRRLCDLIVHMILDILLDERELVDSCNFTLLEEMLEEVCKQANKMERQAEAAEYDGDRLAILKMMKNYIGCEFDGVILEVADRIRVKVNGVDCFIKYRNVSDNFNYDVDNNLFYDKINNQVLKLGSNVKVLLKNVNLNNRTFDVEILNIIDSKKLIK